MLVLWPAVVSRHWSWDAGTASRSWSCVAADWMWKAWTRQLTCWNGVAGWQHNRACPWSCITKPCRRWSSAAGFGRSSWPDRASTFCPRDAAARPRHAPSLDTWIEMGRLLSPCSFPPRPRHLKWVCHAQREGPKASSGASPWSQSRRHDADRVQLPCSDMSACLLILRSSSAHGSSIGTASLSSGSLSGPWG